MATLSYTDSASDCVHGATGEDCVSSLFEGTECDLGTLDYAAGVICDGWSKAFLSVAISTAHSYVDGSAAKSGKKMSRRALLAQHSRFMDMHNKEALRQYDEF